MSDNTTDTIAQERTAELNRSLLLAQLTTFIGLSTDLQHIQYGDNVFPLKTNSVFYKSPEDTLPTQISLYDFLTDPKRALYNHVFVGGLNLIRALSDMDHGFSFNQDKGTYVWRGALEKSILTLIFSYMNPKGYIFARRIDDLYEIWKRDIRDWQHNVNTDKDDPFFIYNGVLNIFHPQQRIPLYPTDMDEVDAILHCIEEDPLESTFITLGKKVIETS